jgi:hypothetical protein
MRDEAVGAQRFVGREALLATIDGRAPQVQPVREYAAVRESAVRLTGSPRAARLFFLDDEPPHLRDRYGRHRFGQSLLLARRLVEGGVPFAAIHFNYMSRCDGWDTHANNFPCLKDELLPLLDQSLSALLEDLEARGRLGETLVVCMGEFGRTPRVNAQGGRDHWGSCASVVMAGGGVQPGRVLGASDRIGAFPETDPFDPADIQATVYHCLGLRPGLEMVDGTNRPMPNSFEQPIRQLLA